MKKIHETLNAHVRHLGAILDDYDALHAYISYNELSDHFRDDTIILITSDFFYSYWCDYTSDDFDFFKDYDDYRNFTNALIAEDIASLKSEVIE